MVCDLVAHDYSRITSAKVCKVDRCALPTFHNVVPIVYRAELDSGLENSKLPDRDKSLGSSGIASMPGRVDDSPRSN
jgi:hypothetical protein